MAKPICIPRAEQSHFQFRDDRYEPSIASQLLVRYKIDQQGLIYVQVYPNSVKLY